MMQKLKFLGGTEMFPQEKLQKAARTASEIVVRAEGPDAPPERLRDALASVLDMLGLVSDDDPRHARLAGAIGDLNVRE